MWIGKVRVMSLTISAYIFVTFFADIGKRSLQQIIQRSETLENRMCSSYHECQLSNREKVFPYYCFSEKLLDFSSAYKEVLLVNTICQPSFATSQN